MTIRPPTTQILGWPSGAPGSPCQRFDVPLGTPQAGNFESDLANGTLPNYSFIAPDLIHDTRLDGGDRGSVQAAELFNDYYC
jgi:hypothetical protein